MSKLYTVTFSRFVSLYGCCLWNCACPSLRSIKVSFNTILRHIWHLPRNCLLHLTARLPSTGGREFEMQEWIHSKWWSVFMPSCMRKGLGVRHLSSAAHSEVMDKRKRMMVWEITRNPIYTHLPLHSTNPTYQKPYLRPRTVLLHWIDACFISVGFIKR